MHIFPKQQYFCVNVQYFICIFVTFFKFCCCCVIISIYSDYLRFSITICELIWSLCSNLLLKLLQTAILYHFPHMFNFILNWYNCICINGKEYFFQLFYIWNIPFFLLYLCVCEFCLFTENGFWQPLDSRTMVSELDGCGCGCGDDGICNDSFVWDSG